MDLLTTIAKWVRQENLFIPFEYLGMLKQLMRDQK